MIIAGITLPNPEWNNISKNNGALHLHTMMNNDKYTYIKKLKGITWEIQIENIPYYKVLLLEDAIATATGTLEITDWWGAVLNVHFLDQPIVATSHRRGKACGAYTAYQMESYNIKLTYEYTY